MPQIRIQTEDFDQHELYSSLATGSDAGAVVTFVGRVRDFTGTGEGLWLEHYPAMTSKVLEQIVAQAHSRWSLLDVRIVHRLGELNPGDQIVFVGVSAPHRQAAFAACEFIMDYLKTEAPFWKKEGTQWVHAKESDQRATERWHEEEP